jgi:hypothetical protein
MQRISAVLALVATGGCVTDDIAFRGDPARNVSVITEPAGALLTIEGVGECETPCTVRLDSPRQANLAKAGFVAQTVTLGPERSSVTIPMELAAASDDVDTTVLPDLN